LVELDLAVIDKFEGLSDFDWTGESAGVASIPPELDGGASGDIEGAVGLLADLLGGGDDFEQGIGYSGFDIGFELADFAGGAVVAHDLFEAFDFGVGGFGGEIGLGLGGGVEGESEFAAHFDFGVGEFCDGFLLLGIGGCF